MENISIFLCVFIFVVSLIFLVRYALVAKKKMTEEEIRKEWLICYVVFYGIHLFCVLLFYFTIELYAYFFVNEIFNVSFNLKLFYNVCISLIGLIISFFIGYHCAYRKKGTIWLLLFLIVNLSAMFIIVKSIVFTGFTEDTIFSGYFVFFPLILLSFITSLRLRKVNSDRRYQEVRDLEKEYERNLQLKEKDVSDGNELCSN